MSPHEQSPAGGPSLPEDGPRSLDGLRARAGSIRGIFTDFDDTLTHRGALVPAAYAAIVQAVEHGLRVVVVTGRPAGWAEVLAATWPIDGAVAENGAVAVRRRPGARTLERLFWDDEAERARQGERLSALQAAVRERLPRAALADDQGLRRCDLAFDVGESQRLSTDELSLLRRSIAEVGARCLVSSVHAHAFFGDHDKARMLVRAARLWWGEDLTATPQTHLFVGDSPNDQAGFAFFPLSAGPSNVRAHLATLAPPPAFIADGEGGHGFAEIVQSVLAASPT